MKLFTVFCFIVLCFLKITAQAQTTYVSQDFSSSNNVNDYVDNTSPDTGEFNFISNGGGSVSISGGELEYVKSTSGGGVLARSTDFSPTPSILLVQFDLTVPSSATNQTTAARFSIGQNFTSSTAAPNNADVHSVLGVNFVGNSGGFSLRNIGSGSNSSTFTGQQTIRWYINNSGATYTYTAPDGSTETLANDAADVFVGTTRVFNEVAATTPTVALTDFKFTFNGGSGGSNGTIRLDNISITSPPDTPLPVELETFTADFDGTGVLLQWKTASEINNAGFEVHRKNQDESSFLKIASYLNDNTLAGIGTDPFGKNYNYRDRSEVLKTGNIYIYKLVQVDFDGTRTEQSETSALIENIVNPVESDISIRPNPAYDAALLSFFVPEEETVSIFMYDALGRLVAKIVKDVLYKPGSYEIRFSTAGIPIGNYTLFVQSRNLSRAKIINIIR